MKFIISILAVEEKLDSAIFLHVLGALLQILVYSCKLSSEGL